MEKTDTIYDYLGDYAIKKKGTVKDRVITEDEPIASLTEYPCFALFMSAHWCPPCVGLLPHLKRFYEEVNNIELPSHQYKTQTQDTKKEGEKKDDQATIAKPLSY